MVGKYYVYKDRVPFIGNYLIPNYKKKVVTDSKLKKVGSTRNCWNINRRYNKIQQKKKNLFKLGVINSHCILSTF